VKLKFKWKIPIKHITNPTSNTDGRGPTPRHLTRVKESHHFLLKGGDTS